MRVLVSESKKKIVPFHVLKIGDYFKYKDCYCLKIGTYNYVYPDTVCGWAPIKMNDTETEVEYLSADVILYEGQCEDTWVALDIGDVFTIEDSDVYRTCIKLNDNLYYNCNNFSVHEFDKDARYKKVKITNICISELGKLTTFAELKIDEGFIYDGNMYIKVNPFVAIGLNTGNKVTIWKDYPWDTLVRRCNIDYVKHEEV